MPSPTSTAPWSTTASAWTASRSTSSAQVPTEAASHDHEHHHNAGPADTRGASRMAPRARPDADRPGRPARGAPPDRVALGARRGTHLARRRAGARAAGPDALVQRYTHK